MDLDAFAWLLTPNGQSALAMATEAYAEGIAPIKLGERLRRTVKAKQAVTVMAQASLRLTAEAKFGPDAARMYFTAEALEQATRTEVARHRARRVSASEPSSVVDLGCGIGGDLLALARTGLAVTGVDRDPLRVAVARANLAADDLPGEVLLGDATNVDLTGFGAAFLDPARRTERGRTFDPSAYSPPWHFVEGLLKAASPPAVVKVAPGLDRALVPEGVEAEWVSYRGAVKEAALWSAPLASVRRRATVIGRSGLASITDKDDPGHVEVAGFGRYLYEPDGAVIRAGLVTAVSSQVDGWLLAKEVAYVSSDEAVSLPWARGYEVLERLPFKEKRLKAALRERGIGKLTIKKRGVDVVPEQLRKSLKLRGSGEATLVLTRAAKPGDSGRENGLALLVQPMMF